MSISNHILSYESASQLGGSLWINRKHYSSAFSGKQMILELIPKIVEEPVLDERENGEDTQFNLIIQLLKSPKQTRYTHAITPGVDTVIK